MAEREDFGDIVAGSCEHRPGDARVTVRRGPGACTDVVQHRALEQIRRVGNGTDHMLRDIHVEIEQIDPAHGDVSSTAVRSGTHDWLTAEAAAFAAETGAWVEPDRYDRWLRAWA